MNRLRILPKLVGRYLLRHRVTAASWTALAAMVVSLLVYALNADGQKAHDAELNDGGVWVTNQTEATIARQNKPLAQIDATVPASQSADVLQDGAAVVAVDGTSLTPVSPSLGVALTDNSVAAAGPAQLGGGSIATIDERTGKLWATRIRPATVGAPDAEVQSLAALDSQAKPIARAVAGSKIVATQTGRVIAVAPDGETTSLVPEASAFAAPTRSDLAHKPSDGVTAVSAVGDDPVVLDKADHIIVPGGDGSLGNVGDAVLQQPGPAASDVLVAADGELFAVALGNGAVRKYAGAAGTPAAPVRIGNRAFAVWADGQTGHIVTVTDGVATDPVAFPLSPGAELVFRVNRNQVLLNDVANGTVWNVDGLVPKDESDWKSIAQSKKNQKQDKNNKDRREIKQPPKAVDDSLGARPGRTTVLHVLDNDLVSGGGVLSIEDVENAPKVNGVSVQLAPDRQSVLLSLSAFVRQDVGFDYKINDGTGGKDSTDTGHVSVAVRTDNGTSVPEPRDGLQDAKPTVWPVVAGGQVEVAVISDWRDPTYGDPVSLDDTVGDSGDVTLTPEGTLRILAGDRAGIQKIGYRVSTGGGSATGQVLLNVLPRDSVKAASPQAEPDVAAGEVGATIKVSPLENDIPGADPTDVRATLALAGNVPQVGGLSVRTDLESGEVSIKARKAGIYNLTYAAGFGIAKRARSTIRVVVDPSSAGNDKPIATPDTTTIRGTVPMTVDVLANDYDAQGRLLAVLHAEPTQTNSGLEVAVVDGRWLRISATTSTLVPVTQAVEYTISNGTAEARGTVTVTQKDPLPSEKNAPITVDDEVTVRVGDTAVVPVLENDSTPSGDPLGLRVPITADVLGELEVSPALGHAYVVGNNVRYVAPPASAIQGPTTVEVSYVAENTADPNRPNSAGTLRVHLNPEPSKDNPNQAPTPRAIEERVVAGDTISVKLPFVGNDPDGDSVTMLAITGAPLYGRILGIGANAIVYQAFPGSSGTDEFGYRVTDRYGATADGTIRVAVTPAGAPQPPVAVNDVITADYNRTVDVDVLANDLRTPGTRLRIEPLDAGSPAKLLSPTGPMRLTAGDDPRRSVVATYRVTNGLDESVGQVTVRSVKGFNNPPVVPDAFAEPKADSATVDVNVLKFAYDIDGEGAPLKVESVDARLPAGAPAPKIVGGTVTLPVLDVPQVVPFRVVDDQGAVTAAAIYVPAKPSGAPYLKPGAVITLKPGQSKDVPLNSIVLDPEGDPLTLTLADLVQAAPRSNLTATAPKSSVLRVKAGSAQGPGAVTFEVSDRAKLTDSDAHVVTLTVPVIVGDGGAILNCPDDPLEITEGGKSPRVIDIASVCHVWTPNPADAAGLTFDASWAPGRKIDNVDVAQTEEGIRLLAGVKARRGDVGSLAVKANGASASDTLQVRVGAAGPPSLAAIAINGVAREKTSVDVAQFGRSPFGSAAEWSIVSITPIGALPGAAPYSEKGTVVTFTPDKFGTYRFRVTLSDAGPGSTRPEASSILTMSVVSEPEKPIGLRTDGQTQSEKVKLFWKPGPSNGGSISKYTVYWNGGKKDFSSTSGVVTGLTNNKNYTFRVTAWNQFGESKESDPVSAKPDRVPDAVRNLHVVYQHNNEVKLAWDVPLKTNHSPIDRYYVSWSGGGEAKWTDAPGTTYTATGLTNGEKVTFSVWAHNAAGFSPDKVAKDGMAAGRPDTPVLQTPETSDRTPTAKAITLRWDPVTAQGPEPVTYQVTRTGGGAPETVCDWTPDTSCSEDVTNDGTSYSYQVQARNAEATEEREPNPSLHLSAISAAQTVEAASRPETPVIQQFVANGQNGKGTVKFNVGASHGKTNQIHCSPSCGDLSTTTVSNGGANNLTATISGFTNGNSNSTFEVWTCNGSSGSAQTGDSCSAHVSDTTTPYGPVSGPSLSVSVSGGCFDWSTSGNANGKTASLVVQMAGTTVDSWSGAGSWSRSGRECPGFSTSKTWKVTVTDSNASTEQPTKRTVSPATSTKSTSSTGNWSNINGPSAPDNTGNCINNCRYISVQLDNWAGYGWCSITHVGSFRGGETWWYRVGPTNGSGYFNGRVTSSTGHVLAYNSVNYNNPINECRPSPPAGASTDSG